MAATLLRPLASLTDFLSKTTLGPVYPYPLTMLLHAARISFVYSTRIRSNTNNPPLSWSQNLSGFLLMCWGGNLLSQFLLCTPPAQILSPHPWIAYSGVHLLLSLTQASTFVTPKTIDTFFPIIDGIMRSGAIIGGISLATTHPNKAVSSSIFTQLVLGGISSAGGGLVASTLGVWNPDWRLSTPPMLKTGGNSLLGTMEFWSGSIAAVIYGVLTYSHQAYAPVFVNVLGIEPRGIATPLGARACVVLWLAPLYAWKAYSTHWATKTGNEPASKESESPAAVGADGKPKAKTQ